MIQGLRRRATPAAAVTARSATSQADQPRPARWYSGQSLSSLPARLRTATRSNWLLAALLLAGLALRVATQLAYRPALFYIDTIRYLYSAQGNDPVAYRLPLRAIAQLINLDAVPVFQHLLGLAMAITIYLVLVRRGAARWLAALAVAPVLLDGYQLQAEQTLMPDVLLEAVIVAGLAALLWRPRLTMPMVIAGGLFLGAAAPVRQVGEVLIVPALCYVLIASRGWRRTAAQAGVLCLAFAVPILAYCTASQIATGHFWLSHTGVTTTYGRMAAAADCATLRLPASQRALCPTPAQHALGPDGLEHSPLSPLRAYYLNKKLAPGEASQLVEKFNHEVLHQQPLRVLRAYGRDVVKLFAVTRTTAPGDTPISRWQFQTTFPTFFPHASKWVIASVVHQFGGGRPRVWRPAAAFLRSYQLDGGYTPGPLLLLATLLGLAGSLTVLRRRRKATVADTSTGARDMGTSSTGAGSADADRRQLALACLLFFLTAVCVLLVADLFEFSWRYQLPALVTLPPAGALGLACLARPARRRSDPATPAK